MVVLSNLIDIKFQHYGSKYGNEKNKKVYRRGKNNLRIRNGRREEELACDYSIVASRRGAVPF